MDTVKVRDGEVVEIRPVEPSDREAVRSGFNRLGKESRYRRFLSPMPSLTENQLSYLTEVDHHGHEALIALHAGDVVGVARFVRPEAESQTAEVAIVVNDEWQGQGLGSALLERLAARAEAEGVRTFTASALTDNRAVIDLLGGLGSVHSTPAASGIVDMEIELDQKDQLEVLMRHAATGVMKFVKEWGRRIPGGPTRGP